MKRRIFKTFIVACSLLAACAAGPKHASAGIVGDAWWAVFGPAGTPWFGARGYSNYGYYGGYNTYYRGGYGYYGGYSSHYGGYNPCRPVRVCPTSCNPCATPCDPCGYGGACAVANGGPRTFRNGTYSQQKPPRPMPDSRFEKREGDGATDFGPTRKEVKEGDKKKTGSDGKTKNGNPPDPGKKAGGSKTAVIREVRKGDGNVPASVVRPRGPVPAKAPKEDGVRIDRLKLDGKITWKPIVRRTRLIITSRLRSPNIVRTSVDPGARWLPGAGGTRVVVQK